MRRCWFIGLVLSMLAGCSTFNPYGSDYGCEGHPDGVNCKSAREVYRLTDYKEALTPEDADDKKGKKSKKQNNQDHQPPAAKAPGPDPAAAAVQGLCYEGPIPLRTSAQVMRIWLAPWESQDGALHLPSYLYVEVLERKWAVGEAKMEIAPRITPLQVEAPSAADTAPRQTQPARPPGRQVQRPPQRPPQQSPQERSPGAAIRPPIQEKSKAVSPFAGFNRLPGQENR